MLNAMKDALVFGALLLSPAIIYAAIRLTIGAWQDAKFGVGSK